MKILIVGSGGREHALAWQAGQSALSEYVYVAPGNAGTAMLPATENIALSVNDIDALIAFAKAQPIGLTIVGPEAPLVAGICDRFAEAGLKCFGPSRRAAQLEGSKSFAKAFMARHHIPTASYQSFTTTDSAIAYTQLQACPIVIKADGLAAGKGVVIAADHAVAESTIRDMLQGNVFGEAGNKVVIESFLPGEEASFICMVDGKHVLAMASSQDHKPAYDGDTGPNTGGMGAYSPSPLVDAAMFAKIMRQVIMPTVNGMKKDGMPYTGFLYAGLMIGADAIPNVVEFNCRFGDPEAQPVLSRLQSDLVAHCIAALDQKLDKQTAVWDQRPALGVVLAAAGYPGDYQQGGVITGLEIADNDHTKSGAWSKVFHSGTVKRNGAIVANGGRVLCVTAMHDALASARAQAYCRARAINLHGAWYRTDIGHRALGKIQAAG